MTDFTINGHAYKTARLDVMVQWAVARRLAPILAEILSPDLIKRGAKLLPKFVNMAQGKSDEGDTKLLEDPNFVEFLELLASAFKPFMTALASLPEQDSDFIISTCLAATQRQQGVGGWATVKPHGSPMMFADIDMVQMLAIVVRVIMFNLSGFSFASLLELAPQK